MIQKHFVVSIVILTEKEIVVSMLFVIHPANETLIFVFQKVQNQSEKIVQLVRF